MNKDDLTVSSQQMSPELSNLPHPCPHLPYLLNLHDLQVVDEVVEVPLIAIIVQKGNIPQVIMMEHVASHRKKKHK
jgi:hypothetical protein